MLSSPSTELAVSHKTVRLPNFELAPAWLLKALEHAASVKPTATEEAGEMLATRVQLTASANVAENAFFVVPLQVPTGPQAIDFDFVASSPQAFFRLRGRPQTIMTYAFRVAYSEGVIETPTDIEISIKFPSLSHFMVAKGDLLKALSADDMAVDAAEVPSDGTAKRHCLRQPDEEGEQSETREDKGMSKYILDLEGVRHFTRVKNDLPQREKQLHFAFRAMEPDRWPYAMGSDFTLQTEEYKRMLLEQHNLRADRRETDFKACGILDRVSALEVTVKTTKMELLLTGSVLVPGAAVTLTLQDFTGDEKILSDSTICPNHNRALVATLRNVQAMLQIVFSQSFRNCFEDFISSLEGEKRTMELAPADFLKNSVETTLQSFFRIVRSVRAADLPEGDHISNPEDCAAYLKNKFDQLEVDLADDNPTRIIEEAYFRKRIANLMSTPAKARPVKPLKAREEHTTRDARVCVGYFGSQLGMKNVKGVVYRCEFGNGCRFSHTSPKGKSAKEIRALIDTLPFNVQDDFRKATAPKDKK